MSRLSRAGHDMERLDELAHRDTFLGRIHPLVKQLVTLLYLVLTVSFSSRQLTGVLGMALYPFLVFEISALSFRDALYRLRIVLPLVCAVGIFNPFFDREGVLTILGVTVTGGVLSMLTLMAKGVLTVLSSYLLIATTPVEDICGAFRMLHVPGILVTEILLIFRYISVLLREADRMTQAYMLRAPGQKGVKFSAWGSLLGLMLLRSMDRAGQVAGSMCLRGYSMSAPVFHLKKIRSSDIMILLAVSAGLAALRVFPLLEFVGSLVM